LRAGRYLGLFKKRVREAVVCPDGYAVAGECADGHHGSALDGCACCETHGDFRRKRLVAVANDGGDAIERGEFPGCALCVTAGDNDARLGIRPVRAADVCARLAVGLRGDAAGVDDDHFRLANRACGKPA
jgi:hypothetical protein